VQSITIGSFMQQIYTHKFGNTIWMHNLVTNIALHQWAGKLPFHILIWNDRLPAPANTSTTGTGCSNREHWLQVILCPLQVFSSATFKAPYFHEYPNTPHTHTHMHAHMNTPPHTHPHTTVFANSVKCCNKHL
jgi:hypothetical protein